MPTHILRIAGLFGLVAVAAYFNYFTSEVISSLFFLSTLVAYFYSRNEAFWLMFFLFLSDGFFGFFGLYQVVLTVIPGLPPVEIGQLYIVLTLVKAGREKLNYRPFTTVPLLIVGVYMIFLLIQGYVVGVSMALNVQFRILKWLLPFGLLYSLPRLLRKEENYHELFTYLFVAAFTALASQFITIMTSSTPPQLLGVNQDAWFAIQVSAEKTYRGLYNDSVILLSFFGALFYLAQRNPPFHSLLLFAVIVADFASVFLSATRGWTIALSFALFFATFLALRFTLSRVLIIGVVGVLFAISVRAVPLIGIQLTNAVERMLTLNKLAEGDMSAGGTLIRLNTRGPRVMSKWKESKLTGWGYSDTFMAYNDFHVGNQNILLHSGILGALVMAWFFGMVCFKVFIRYRSTPSTDPYRRSLLVIIIFFGGWFLLHSSSEQLFSYYTEIGPGMMLAVYLSFTALVYQLSLQHSEKEVSSPEDHRP